MPFSIHDYLIDPAGIDWDAALAAWAWLLPENFSLSFVNRFADLFVIVPDGSVHIAARRRRWRLARKDRYRDPWRHTGGRRGRSKHAGEIVTDRG